MRETSLGLFIIGLLMILVGGGAVVFCFVLHGLEPLAGFLFAFSGTATLIEGFKTIAESNYL